jgi:transglutaminase-like putative cysteine protease
MKSIILLMLLFSPLIEVVDVQFSIPTHQHEIFCNYSNDNYSQEVFYDRTRDEITAHIKNSNFLTLDLNFRIIPDNEFIAGLSPELRETTFDLLDNCFTFATYFENISSFLKEHITYSDNNLPQDAASVILNKKANCKGYSHLVRVLLKAAGIKSKIVRGFYLQKDTEKKKNNTLIPIPHRWMEIYLSNEVKFFYDPQYQRFSFNYLTTRNDINFKQVKKFKVNIIKKSKKIINQ